MDVLMPNEYNPTVLLIHARYGVQLLIEKQKRVIKVKSSCIRSKFCDDELSLDRLLKSDHPAFPGELIFGSVTRVTDHYSFIENEYGRNVRLYEGDFIVGVLGTRRSTTNVSGWSPRSIASGMDLALISPSGILGVPDERQSVAAFTLVRVIGSFQSPNGTPLNLSNAPHTEPDDADDMTIPLLLVCGTSAECGKTTAACTAIRALLQAKPDLSISATKLCGTGRRRDCYEYCDAGASHVEDFVDLGFASTYGLSIESFTSVVHSLLLRGMRRGDIVVAEIGGDLTEKQAMLALQTASEFRPCILALSNDAPGMLSLLSICRGVTHRAIVCASIKQNLATLAERIDSCVIDPRDSTSMAKIIASLLEQW
jgi:hypothetical protein